MSLSQKYVTIASDISNGSSHRVGTWAFYIRHNGGVIKKVGRFKQYHKNTALAETYALINALVIAEKLIPDWSESRVIIYNEVEYALDPILTKAGNVRGRDKERTDAIREIALPILSKAQSWERRKIKAHFKDWEHSDNPKKYAINRWCDQESRKEMRKIKRRIDKQRKRLRL